jgi:hypothetical protein
MFISSEHMVEIMTVDIEVDGTYYFRTLNSLESNLKPVTLQGDLLAISDDVARTVMWDWRMDTSAILEHEPDHSAIWVASRFLIALSDSSDLIIPA